MPDTDTKERRPPGRAPRHGSRALARLLKANELDRRTRTGKMLSALEHDLASDAGGLDALTARERMLLKRCAAQALIISSIEAWAFGQATILDADSGLLPVLAKSYLGYCNSLRRSLESLGLRPVPFDVSNLSDVELRQLVEGVSIRDILAKREVKPC